VTTYPLRALVATVRSCPRILGVSASSVSNGSVVFVEVVAVVVRHPERREPVPEERDVRDLRLHQEYLKNGVCYIYAEGYLDAHTFVKMENLVQSVFRRGCYRLVVRLDKVDYISSAGAGVFVGAIGEAKDSGGDIVFLRPSPAVKEEFDLLGLSAIFRFADSIQEATACF